MTAHRRARILLVSSAAAVALAAVVVSSLLWSSPAVEAARTKPRKCLPYFLIPQVWICGNKVFLKHPHKRRQYMGRTSDLAPMPKPPQRRS